MIRRVAFLALWAASPSLSQVGSTALFTEFESRPALVVLSSLRQEVESLLAPNGLHFEWKSLPSNDRSTWTELAVIKFSGRCETLPFASNRHYDRRLGWTHISDGEILPFAEIDCDAIRAFVLKDLFALPPDSRDSTYGRAIGRVTAHELLHIFARSASHGAHGVDHPTLTVADLLGQNLVLADREPELHIIQPDSRRASTRDAASAQAGQDAYLRDGCSSCHGEKGEGTRQGPVLRTPGNSLNPVVLKAKLAKSESKMCKLARSLRVMTPSLPEEEINDLVRFLNQRN